METHTLRLDPEAVNRRPALVEHETTEDLYLEGGEHPAVAAAYANRMKRHKGSPHGA